MKMILLLAAFLSSSLSFAADTEVSLLHKNDYKWFQFNIMQSIDNKIPFQNQQDTYLELEFGGRSGIFDLYGYLDVFDIFDSPQSDRHDNSATVQDDNFFFKFAPRVSLNAVFGQDKYEGFVSEVYISGLMNVGDRSLFEQYIGLGSDIQMPWMGKMGLNLMARYVRENFQAENEGRWDGYILSTNWFKPFYDLGPGTLTYQGYLDYKFAATQISDDTNRSEDSLEWFNGLYWHTKQYALGYGLKYYKDMALLKDGGFAGETTGFGHYLSVTYKF